jgi:UDP-N-acetylglucosamine:LPS N-acetylglucosamine transferase
VAPGGDVLAVIGAGGHEVTAEQVLAAAATTPERTWHLAGALRASGAGVHDHGPRADVAELMRRCSVVVGSAGGNVVAEVAAARRPYVCLPQPRPFDEQHRQAEALRRLGVAVIADRWPEAAAWPDLLASAEASDTGRWAELHDGAGASRLAAVVREVAGAAG